MNGYGERAGNADLVQRGGGNLQLKFGCAAPRGRTALREMARIAHAISRGRQPVAPDTRQPYVGFVGVRAQGRAARLGDPGRSRCCTSTPTRAEVGNDMRMLVSDMAGRANGRAQGRASSAIDLSDNKRDHRPE
jgi:2-isopropylmalate synthase